MKRFASTVAVLALTAGTAIAESHSTEADLGVSADASAMSGIDSSANAEGTMTADTGVTAADGSMGADVETSTMDSNTAVAMSETTDLSDPANLIRTRDITGGDIYSLKSGLDDDEWGANDSYDAVGNDWNDIGEIEDIILDRNGQMVGIVAEVGGFLDIGDKHVVLSVDDVKLVAIDDGEYAYVTRRSEEQLEEMQSVDEGFWE